MRETVDNGPVLKTISKLPLPDFDNKDIDSINRLKVEIVEI